MMSGLVFIIKDDNGDFIEVFPTILGLDYERSEKIKLGDERKAVDWVKEVYPELTPGKKYLIEAIKHT